MKSLAINIEVEDFWFNFFELKDSFDLPLPIDTIQYKCNECKEELVLFPNGDYYYSSDFDSFEDLIEKEKDNLIKSHSDNCMKPDLTLHPDFGVPDNILFLVQGSNQDAVKPFKLEDIQFSPVLSVTKNDVPALVIFQSNNAQQETYTKLITKNFDTYLNIPNPKSDDNTVTIDDINDEDELHENQQNLPRLLGGGRSFLQEVKYVCQWCTHEQLQKPTRGRFREIKNYRDHFRTYHSDIPFHEFLNRVQRQEPKWQCKICRQRMSLSNQLRHQVICRPKKFESSSDSETDNDQNENSHESSESQSQSNEAKESESDSEDDIQPRGRIKKRAISSSDSSSQENEEDFVKSVVKKVVWKIRKYNIENEVMEALENETFSSNERKVSNNNVENEVVELVENEASCSNARTIFKQNIENEVLESLGNEASNCDDSYEQQQDSTSMPEKRQSQGNSSSVGQEYQVLDEVLPEESDPYKFDDYNEEEEIIHGTNVPDKPLESVINQGDELMKWWQGIPNNAYYKVEGCPLEIFKKTDSENFIKTVIEQYKHHTQLKTDLDKQNEEFEKSDERFNQFSDDRDKPFVDQYIEYVSNHSTKEIINLLGTNADETSSQKKSRSTAKQYSYRILELFNYIAKLHYGFHFDWFIDYSNLIEKKMQNDVISTEIFIPSKQVLTDFIKSYMYGSNPAANCGLRIFAVKKMLEFLMQKYKDNEDRFPGDIVTRNKLVDSLNSKLKNISEDLCPAGMIKHISIASNNNHRKTLADKMKQYPEKSIENIMKGVGEYLMSDDYAQQKENLYHLAYDKTRMPSRNEYMKATNWLLEQLICIGGNRPCALLGLTVGDWENKKAGYCPFNQSEDNDLIEEDPKHDSRKILKDPFQRPKGCVEDEPTGIIVKSDGDKITVGPPCYIWFPNELCDLVQAHSLLASKYLHDKVDIHHPNTYLFLNSAGNQITQINCNTFKEFLGLPITAYDFRRSLSTFCFDNQNENIRKSEPSVLRHNLDTGFAYYFQKHSEVK